MAINIACSGFEWFLIVLSNTISFSVINLLSYLLHNAVQQKTSIICRSLFVGKIIFDFQRIFNIQL